MVYITIVLSSQSDHSEYYHPIFFAQVLGSWVECWPQFCADGGKWIIL